MRGLLAVLILSGFTSAPALPQQALPSPAKNGVPGGEQTVRAIVNANNFLPEPKPLPKGETTLLGGTVDRLDRVRCELTVAVFGGRGIDVVFDERTEIYLDGVRTSQRDLREGARVYLETLLDGTQVFARSIHIMANVAMGESRGQVLAYDRSSAELTLRDPLSPETVKLVMAPKVLVLHKGQNVATSELRRGSLVTVKFLPNAQGQGVVQEVSILATPGTSHTFIGRVTYLDLRNGLLVLVDPRDHQSYEIHIHPAVVRLDRNFRQGADVTVSTIFSGSRYVANAITVNPPSGQ